MAKKMHLWRYNDDDLSDIVDLDKKWKDYSSVKLDGFLLNRTDEQKTKQLKEIDLADEDVIIVEMEKEAHGKSSFVFQPL
jgi:hypothetical protein